MAASAVSKTVWSASTVLEVNDQPYEEEALLRLAYTCINEAVGIFQRIAKSVERHELPVEDSNDICQLYHNIHVECVKMLRDVPGLVKITS